MGGTPIPSHGSSMSIIISLKVSPQENNQSVAATEKLAENTQFTTIVTIPTAILMIPTTIVTIAMKQHKPTIPTIPSTTQWVSYVISTLTLCSHQSWQSQVIVESYVAALSVTLRYTWRIDIYIYILVILLVYYLCITYTLLIHYLNITLLKYY